MKKRKRKKQSSGKGWELVRGRSAEELLPRRTSATPAEQRIELRIEKRPGFKSVTTATGFLLIESDLKVLAKQLKAACGSGGSIRKETGEITGGIEIQGEHADKLRDLLTNAGYEVS